VGIVPCALTQLRRFTVGAASVKPGTADASDAYAAVAADTSCMSSISVGFARDGRVRGSNGGMGNHAVRDVRSNGAMGDTEVVASLCALRFSQRVCHNKVAFECSPLAVLLLVCDEPTAHDPIRTGCSNGEGPALQFSASRSTECLEEDCGGCSQSGGVTHW